MKCKCSVVRPEEGDEDEDNGEDDIAGIPGGGEQKGRGAMDESHVCFLCCGRAQFSGNFAIFWKL